MQHKQRTAALISLLLGVAGTIQYHSAQFLSGFDTFPGDRGDARGFAYFLEHWYQSILGKASLLSPAIFYPTRRTLAFSDLLFGFALPYSFFRALGFGMFTSVQLVIVLITFLSFCTAFWLLYRTLNFGAVASCAGAMFFAFSAPKFFQTIHLQLQFVVLLPVIFALAITFAKQIETMDQKRAAILLSLIGLCLNVQLATAFYYAWFFALWATFFFLLALAFSRTRRFIFTVCQKFWRALLVAGFTFLLLFIPIFLVYLPTIKVGEWYHYDSLLEMVPHWRALLSMGAGNYIWGKLCEALMPVPLDSTWGELQVGIGLIPSLLWIVLTVATLWFIIRRRNSNSAIEPAINRDLEILFLACLILATTIFYLIGFRYAGHSPWIYVYKFFPGGGAIRGVARYVLFLTLPMCIAFAYVLHKGLEYASRQAQPRKRALTIVMIALGAIGVFEQFGVNKIGGTGFSKSVEERYLKAMAAKLTPDCVAFYVAPGPHANHSIAEYHYDGMMLSAFSRVPTLNASSSQFPRDWNLYFIKNPDYEAKVQEWIDSQKLTGKICRLEIAPQVEAFDFNMPSPVDDPEFFVRQVYRDFAGREPEAPVLAPQVEKIKNCRPSNQSCDRAQVALNTFLGTGFHERGAFIVRMYEAGLGRPPRYEEFIDAMRRVDEYRMTEPPPVVTERMFVELTQSAEFAQRNDGRPAPVREQSLRQLVASDEFVRKTGNRSFVILHYFGYLRRDPDAVGLDYWVDQLDRGGDSTKITDAFINSVEYRERFRH